MSDWIPLERAERDRLPWLKIGAVAAIGAMLCGAYVQTHRVPQVASIPARIVPMEPGEIIPPQVSIGVVPPPATIPLEGPPTAVLADSPPEPIVARKPAVAPPERIRTTTAIVVPERVIRPRRIPEAVPPRIVRRPTLRPAVAAKRQDSGDQQRPAWKLPSSLLPYGAN